MRGIRSVLAPYPLRARTRRVTGGSGMERSVASLPPVEYWKPGRSLPGRPGIARMHSRSLHIFPPKIGRIARAFKPGLLAYGSSYSPVPSHLFAVDFVLQLSDSGSVPDFVPVYSSGGCDGFSPPSHRLKAGFKSVSILQRTKETANVTHHRRFSQPP